jgi:hypothetical protein
MFVQLKAKQNQTELVQAETLQAKAPRKRAAF